MFAAMVAIDVAMAFNRRFFTFLLRLKIDSLSLLFIAVACPLRMNLGMIQCCRKRLYNPETHIAPVPGTEKYAHR